MSKDGLTPVSRQPYIADGKFLVHPCCHEGCKRDGVFGVGGNMRKLNQAVAAGDSNAMRFAGKWWCKEHAPDEIWAGKHKAQVVEPHRKGQRVPVDVVKRTQFRRGQGVLL